MVCLSTGVSRRLVLQIKKLTNKGAMPLYKLYKKPHKKHGLISQAGVGINSGQL